MTETTSLGRSIRAVLATVVLMSALVTGAGVAAAAIPQTKAVPVKQWTASVCTDIARWQQTLVALGPATPADVAAAKKTIIGFFAGAVRATDALAKDLKAVGTPAVKHGTAIAATFARSVASQRAAFAKSRTDAKALPTGDPTAFATAAQVLASRLQASVGTLDTTLAKAAKKYPATRLPAAFASSKACTALA